MFSRDGDGGLHLLQNLVAVFFKRGEVGKECQARLTERKKRRGGTTRNNLGIRQGRTQKSENDAYLRPTEVELTKKKTVVNYRGSERYCKNEAFFRSLPLLEHIAYPPPPFSSRAK